ncbi:MAG: hypothetical protein WAT14_09475 [Chitinophagaceae bacterium]|jgi:hypothetical protein
MRLLFASLIIALFMVSSFSSCQKEVEGNLPVLIQSDSSFIDKIIALDTTLPAGADTTEKMFFSYDNAKRLSKSTQLYGTGFIASSVTDFLYAGNDTLPYKKISREVYTGLWDYTDTTYYTYSNGFIVKDSTITHDNTNSVIGAVVRQYSISGTTVSKGLRTYDFNGGNFVLQTSNNSLLTVTFTAGNLVSQTLVTGTNTFESVQAVYDTKPNPILKAFKTKYPEADTPDWQSWLVQKNNPSQIQYMEMGGPLETESYVYTYRGDGYPVKFTYSTTAGFQLSNKVLFFYKTI